MDLSLTKTEVPCAEAASCTECRRRKQKCNREWPCQRCQQRRVPQLCDFSIKHNSQKQKFKIRGTKRSTDSLGEPPPPVSSDEIVDTNEEFVALGYMPAASLFNLESAIQDGYTRSTKYNGPAYVDEVNAVLCVFPERFLTDLLVQGFLYHVNYFYYVVYPPQFLDDYAEWWKQRKEGTQLSPAFTCLLVRACAYSAQFLQLDSRHLIETKLGKSAQVLSEQFHDAANRLSFCFKPGTGGLMQVQQLFISACWYKSESKFRESWHALASAIREAQEIGLHRDILAKRCTPFEFEMRRRVWCLLYVWDLQLSSWLNRPLLIDQKSSVIEAPNLRIDTFENIPSPFLPISIQYDMCIRLYNMPDADKQDFRLVLAEMEDWMNSFPPFLRMKDPDTSRDLEWPHIRLQREYLLTVAHMFLIGPLKPCLTKTVLSEAELAYRPVAVDTCLRTLATAQRLFDIMIPDSAKAFIVTCATFEPSALLTSAVIHDKFGTLPRRQEILAAIDAALAMLSKIATRTNTGSVAYGILTRLTASLAAHEQPSLCKRQRLTSTSEESTSSSSSQLTDSSADSLTQADTYPAETAQDLQSDLTFYPTVRDFENANFHGLEDLWDWHILNLNVLGDENAPASFGPLNEMTAIDASADTVPRPNHYVQSR